MKDHLRYRLLFLSFSIMSCFAREWSAFSAGSLGTQEASVLTGGMYSPERVSAGIEELMTGSVGCAHSDLYDFRAEITCSAKCAGENTEKSLSRNAVFSPTALKLMAGDGHMP